MTEKALVFLLLEAGGGGEGALGGAEHKLPLLGALKFLPEIKTYKHKVHPTGIAGE